MNTCKDCACWAKGKSGWGYCDRWIPEDAPFNVICTDHPDANVEMETHENFGCSAFVGESEHE